MIPGSKVRLHRTITELWFIYAGKKATKGQSSIRVHRIPEYKVGRVLKDPTLKLASVVSDNKKGFFKYINSKRRFKENIGPILVEDGHLTNRN